MKGELSSFYHSIGPFFQVETTGTSFMMPNTMISNSLTGNKHTSHSFSICKVKWRLLGWWVRQA